MEKEVEYGVFMPVGEGGWIRSTTAPAVPATYAYNRQVAILAEQLGLDFLLAMAKWRGFGGASRHWDTTLESMTVITALAEVTTRVRLIPTVHTLAFNVALVAKSLATLDQIAHGRAGLNVVSGWFRDEFEQMGLWPGHHLPCRALRGCPRMGAGPETPLAGGTGHLPGALSASGRLYLQPETAPKTSSTDSLCRGTRRPACASLSKKRRRRSLMRDPMPKRRRQVDGRRE